MNRAADGLDYPEQGQSSLRNQSYDANGEPLCALPEDNQTKPAALNAWDSRAPLTFHEAIQVIVKSKHHLNSENQE
jgi:hypothetical protein